MRKCAASASRELPAGKARVNLISTARENDSLVHLSMLSLSSSVCVCVCVCVCDTERKSGEQKIDFKNVFFRKNRII